MSLRLAARCNAAPTATNGTASDDDRNTMFSELADDPLGVSIPVGAVDLSGAGGAAVMNAVLVVTIGVVLHAAALLQRCVRHSATSTLASLQTISRTETVSDVAHTAVSLLPASRLPGSLAVSYGTLLQPGIGACVALIVSSARTPASVACGVIVAIAWILLPVYSVFAVVRGGRVHDGVFALQSASVGDTRQTKTSRRSNPSAVTRALSALQRAHRYAPQETARGPCAPLLRCAL